MKRRAYELFISIRSILPLRVCLLVAAMAGLRTLSSPFLLMPGQTIGSVLTETLGGPVWDMFIGIDASMDWLLALMPPLTGLVIYIQRAAGPHQVFTLHRNQSMWRWMLQKLILLFFYAFVCTFLMAGTIILISWLYGMKGLYVFAQDAKGFLSMQYYQPLLSMLCFSLQSLMLMLIFQWVYLVSGSVSWSVVAFMLPVIWGLMSGSSDENPRSIHVFINWGLFSRYTRTEGMFGVPVAWGLVRQAGLVAVLMLANLLSSPFIRQDRKRRV
jgi:hypothetical protein